ncbi:hypothetical protein DLM_1940 [Aquitalea magnusonii]|uniref:N-acetyltransferase domain-containing protein n=2 Tax=Aquitalea magnusonii TaxID=332411 RepID=A0A3G9GJI0_9NEIS|nr:hypothetical protein DLM_1940 [Aquitalea magnusonii]
MLATDPAMQAQGLGKQMLRHAEAYATEHLFDSDCGFNMMRL